MTVETASKAINFTASIGVNGHLSGTTSSYASSNVAGQMAYLGIDNMRISDYVGTRLSAVTALGAAGIKFDLITVIAPQNPINLTTEMSEIDALAPYTISVEGPNEVNSDPVTYNGVTGAAAAEAFQADLYASVHADPLLQGVKVLPYSLSVGASLTGFGNVTQYADEGNVHGYASDGVPPNWMLGYAVSSVTTVVGKPVVMSETGNYTLSNGGSGVTQDVQAKWLMDTLLDNYQSGVAKTYLYQLEDDGTSTTDPEQNYGLYTAAGAPKQSAVDIHNLTTILADNGATAATFTPGTLDYTVSGLPYYANQQVFAKSNGSFDIALWAEPDFFNATTDVENAVTPSTINVALGGAYNVTIYDPVVGTTAITSYTNVTSLQVSLGTDPLIVEVTPVSPGSVTFPVVTLGTGLSSITVDISEDAYLGNAQFTLAVDGVQIGGTQTATALHGAGQTQAFTLDGNFAAGAHTVTATFLNDAYGGSANTDRNLYVDSIIAGGVTTAVATELASAGSASFTATLPSTAPVTPPRAQISATNLVLGKLTTIPGTLTIDNADWTDSGSTIVGLKGNGTLVLQNTGTAAISGSLHVATNTSSVGAVTLQAGTTLKVGTFAAIGDYAAHTGSATVTINAGSEVDVASTVSVYSASSIALAGGTFSGANLSGTVGIAARASVSGYGLVKAGNGSTVSDSGTITATGGMLEIGNSLTGSGALNVAANSTAKVDGSSIGLASIGFTGSNGTLMLATRAAVRSGITGFAAGDQIIMSGIDTASWNAAKGALTLTQQGAVVDTLHLSGSYTGVFNVQQTSAGGVITLNSH